MGNDRSLASPNYTARTTLTTDNRLPAQFRLLGRLVWGITVVEMVGLTLAGAVPRFNQLVAQNQAQRTLLGSVGLSSELATAVLFGWAIVIFLAFCIPAVLIYLRRPDDWIAIIVSITVVGVGCASTNFPDALRDLYAAQLPWLAILTDFSAAVGEGMPVVAMVFFPTGRAEPRWMRWGALAILAWTLARPLLYFTPYHPSQWSAAFLAGFLLVTLGSAVASQVYRYRVVSTQVQRQQTKWITFGATSGILGLVGLKVVLAIFPVLSTPGSTTYVTWQLIEYSIYSLSLLPFPLAFTISTLRYRLWDIDFIINRSLVYGLLTLLLAAVFGGSLLAAQALIARFTTNGEVFTLGVFASAVVAGLIFQPTRSRLRRFVDRRFYGIQIDYKRALRAEAARDYVARRTADTLTSFGPYTNAHLIGRGGMGEVYHAMHPTLRRPVAIKLLPPAMAADEYARKRFLREAQTIARLKHASIVGITDYGEAEGTPYMVMDFVAGLSLAEFMAERGPLPLPEALLSLEDIASALDYAHQEGVVHRDVKPSNVVLQPVTQSSAEMMRLYRAVLMDFGIARLVTDATSQLTLTGMIGTIDYIAPEQIQGAATVSGQADLYSMAIMAYQMLTGRLPFTYSNPAAMLIAHLMEPPPDPRQFIPDIPPHACLALVQALAKKPDERFKSCEAFVGALRG